eukprot:2561425-Pleurochrysis_carterae.AAC.1
MCAPNQWLCIKCSECFLAAPLCCYSHVPVLLLSFAVFCFHCAPRPRSAAVKGSGPCLPSVLLLSPQAHVDLGYNGKAVAALQQVLRCSKKGKNADVRLCPRREASHGTFYSLVLAIYSLSLLSTTTSHDTWIEEEQRIASPYLLALTLFGLLSSLERVQLRFALRKSRLLALLCARVLEGLKLQCELTCDQRARKHARTSCSRSGVRLKLSILVRRQPRARCIAGRADARAAQGRAADRRAPDATRRWSVQGVRLARYAALVPHVPLRTSCLRPVSWQNCVGSFMKGRARPLTFACASALVDRNVQLNFLCSSSTVGVHVFCANLRGPTPHLAPLPPSPLPAYECIRRAFVSQPQPRAREDRAQRLSVAEVNEAIQARADK